jgi:hypothetical protein
MPKSKSKRRRYQPPPKPKPKPSGPIVPIAFWTLLLLGFLLIVARFALSSVFTVFEAGWPLIAGLLMIAAAFAVATRWR